MISLTTLAGKPVNTFPTLRAVAYACEGLDDHELWALSFMDIARGRRISWVTVRAEIEKVKRLSGYGKIGDDIEWKSVIKS